MIRLLHISDIHLNTGFSSKDRLVREFLRDGLLRSFERAIDYVLEENLDGLIIAGDLMDNNKLSFRIEQNVIFNFEKLCGNNKHIFYVTGNHDPMNTLLFLKHFDGNPNFHYFAGDDIKHIKIEMKDDEVLEIVACGHKSKNEKRNLIKQFPRKNNGSYWIGIAHSSVASAFTVGTKEAYMATSLEDIELLRYDYFALGHIHVQQMLTDKIAYSGNIQGINYKEIGEKGGLLVELKNGATNIIPVVFNEIQWEAFDFEITEEIDSITRLEESLVDFVSEQISDIPKSSNHLIVRVNLEGKTSLIHALNDARNLEYIEEIVSSKVGLLGFDIKLFSVTGLQDKAFLLNEKTVLSEALNIIKNHENHEELIRRLMELPIEKNNEDMLKEKLKSLEDSLIERFTRGRI